jgi:phytol kinase
MSVGTFVAFWPHFLSWQQIRLLSLAFVAGVLISLYFNIFRAIHAVERPTWGEVMFAISVGLTTLITNDANVYMAAILLMSLADGLAAVIGTLYGSKTAYRVFAQRKSLIGSLTFFITAFASLVLYDSLSAAQLSLVAITGLSLLTTAVENISVRGFDNLFVPVIVAAILQYLS